MTETLIYADPNGEDAYLVEWAEGNEFKAMFMTGNEVTDLGLATWTDLEKLEDKWTAYEKGLIDEVLPLVKIG